MAGRRIGCGGLLLIDERHNPGKRRSRSRSAADDSEIENTILCIANIADRHASKGVVGLTVDITGAIKAGAGEERDIRLVAMIVTGHTGDTELPSWFGINGAGTTATGDKI